MQKPTIRNRALAGCECRQSATHNSLQEDLESFGRLHHDGRNMKRSSWLIIGFILAVAIGFLLFKLWNLIAGAFAAMVLFAAFRGIGRKGIWLGQ